MNITEKMRRNAQKSRERLEEIRSDWTLSDAAKRQEIQAAFEEARTTHARLAQEYRAGVRERLRRSRKAAFAAPKIAGSDKALDLMAYRDALDRASGTTDQRTLSDMLARAEIVGDAPVRQGHALERLRTPELEPRPFVPRDVSGPGPKVGCVHGSGTGAQHPGGSGHIGGGRRRARAGAPATVGA
jgi:hypothetical protein